MPDMEKSFSFLQDSVPQWLEAITSAERKVAAMQDEITRIVALKKISDSAKSIRLDDVHATPEHALSNGAQTDPLGKRKRNTTSLLSGRASGPSRYRSRTMVVVDYDGDMQKSFEDLVRAIGTGRNLLRKAKMEAKMQELEALQESSGEDDQNDTGSEQELTAPKPNIRARMSTMRAMATMRRGGAPALHGVSDTTWEVLDRTDKTLEQAQELCEKAAHLILREGDCRKELEATRKNFETVLETAKNEVVKCSSRKPHEPPELVSHDTSDTSVSSIDTSDKEHVLQGISLPIPDAIPKPLPLSLPGTSTADEPKILDIEVDDNDDGDEEEFIMPPIRLTSRLGARR